jgi:hypothetical protein
MNNRLLPFKPICMNPARFLLLLFLFVFATHQSSGQAVIFKGGYTFSNQTFITEDFDFGTELKGRNGFNLGVAYEYPLSDLFALEPGLYYKSKGFRRENTEVFGPQESKIDVQRTLAINSLDFGIFLTANYEIGDDMFILGNFGPYLGYAISAKYKSQYKAFGETDNFSEGLSLGDDETVDIEKPLDFGLNFGAGFRYLSYQINFTYDLGLANLSNTSQDGLALKNQVFMVSAGYYLEMDTKKKRRRGKKRRRRRR